jgi:hypothetical protein
MLCFAPFNVDRIQPVHAGVSARLGTDLGMTSTQQPQAAT